MKNELEKQAYESPETEIVLLALEQCIAASTTLNNWSENNNYDEDF